MFLFEGIILIKLWFDVSNEQQELRFQKRLSRPWKRWKLSPMDLYARSRWSDYAEARDVMFARTGSTVPWAVIPSDDKKVARLNAITHILASIDYEQIEWDDVTLPEPESSQYVPADFDGKTAKVVPQVYSPSSLLTDDDGTLWTSVADAMISNGTRKSKKVR